MGLVLVTDRNFSDAIAVGDHQWREIISLGELGILEEGRFKFSPYCNKGLCTSNV